MAIQAFSKTDAGQYKMYMTDLIKGIYYAISNGAEVINVSSGSYVYN